MLDQLQIRKRILVNSSIMAGSRGASAGLALLLVPVIISKLGIVALGTWEIIFSVATLCSMAQGAIVNTLLWQVSGAYGRQDADRVRQLLRASVFVTLLQLALTIPPVWLLRDALIGLFNVPPSMHAAAELALPAFCAMMILNGINECMGAVISGYQHAGLVSAIQSAAQAINYSVTIACILAGMGLLSFFVGYAFNYVFAGLAYAKLASRFCPRLTLRPAFLPRHQLRELSGYFFLLLVGSLSGVLRDAKDKVILSTLSSPVMAGYYAVAQRLVGFLSLMTTFFYLPTTAAVGALSARGEWPTIQRIYGNTIALVTALVGFTAVLAAGLQDRLIILWTGTAMPQAGTIVLWLVFGNITAIILAGPGAAICKGIGRLGMEASYWAIGILLNVALTAILLSTSGAMGSVAASSLSWAISSAFFLVFMHRSVDLPWRLSRRAIRGLLIVLVTALLLWLVSSSRPPTGTRSEAFWFSLAFGALSFLLYEAQLIAARVVPFSRATVDSLITRKSA